MKTWKLTACLSVGLSLMAGLSWSRPVDLSAPTGEVGASNMRGYLEVWREIHEVGLDLGKGSYLPLRYRFSSEDNSAGMLGAGFYVPIFEARSVLIREQMMRANLPCGKALYMRRDPAETSKFQTLDQQWTGLLSEDGSDFTLWRNDGWKLFYHKSRLTSLTTDDNHAFTWSYHNGVGASVSKDGQTILTVEPNVAGQVAAFVFDGKRYEVEYAERPITQMLLGQVAIKELDQALSSFKYSDGSIETFKFTLTPDRVPTLTFTNANKEQTAYAWDAATGQIASENGSQGNWIYQVGKIAGQFELPTVTRTSPKGESTSVAINNKAGTTTEKALDGKITVTSVFETPGPLYGKVKQVTDTSATGETRTLIRLSYDETGRIIRKIDVNGFATLFTYGGDGKLAKRTVEPPSGPAILKVLQEREKVLLGYISNSKTPAEKDDYFGQLGLFYIYKVGDINKALSVIQRMSNPNGGFGIRMHSILGNQNLTSSEKAAQLQTLLSDFPTEKEELVSKINFYLSQNS